MNLVFKNVFRALQDAKATGKPIFVVTHEWPDGDAVGSAIGMCDLLKTNGFPAQLHIQKELPDCYREFLPELPDPPTAEVLNRDFSMVLNLDASTIRRIALGGINFDSIQIPFVTMDHHPDNERFGTLSCVEPEDCSTAELITRFAKDIGWKISPYAATMLLLGITTDTGCFRFSNTDAAAHTAAAYLLAHEADQNRIIEAVYFTKPMNMVRFETELLHEHFQSAFDGKFAYVNITRELLDKFDINLRNTEQLIEIIRGIEGVVVAALIKPTSSPTIFKVSIRSKKETVSAGRIARSLKGGGHEMAAGCSIFAKSASDAEEILLRHVKVELYHEI